VNIYEPAGGYLKQGAGKYLAIGNNNCKVWRQCFKLFNKIVAFNLFWLKDRDIIFKSELFYWGRF